ncbi:hypothetical protein FRC02_008556 [Tulasnella sp. 418]|nr:hypothetical protein FRC02_008556 [Tulasnella sp. 418]
MPSKCKPNNTASKQNLAKKNAQLTAELAKHKERAERAESAYRKLEKRQKLQRAREHAAERKSPRLIERPPGQNRKHGWRLIEKMELGENLSSTADEARKNKLLYNTMLVRVTFNLIFNLRCTYRLSD